jgi:hypothetical protein
MQSTRTLIPGSKGLMGWEKIASVSEVMNSDIIAKGQPDMCVSNLSPSTLSLPGGWIGKYSEIFQDT